MKIKRLIAAVMLLGLFTLSACDSTEETDISDIEESESVAKKTESQIKESEEKKEENLASWQEDKWLKILTIGNSFSDDTMEYVYQIAKSAGVNKIKLGNLYIGSCTLDLHAQNAKQDKGAYDYRTNFNGTWQTQSNYKMSDAISSENWDFISIQQASGSSGIEDTYSELGYMLAYIEDNAIGNPQIVWNMTWAYQQDSTHGEFGKYQNSQLVMYDMILETVKAKVETKDSIKIISPTGTAIQNARTSFVGDNLTRDGFHLSPFLGRYIAGLTFFHKLTGISIEDLKYKPVGICEDYQKIAIEAAINAVKEPYDITDSEYTLEATLDLDKYEVLDLDWTLLGYWNSSSGKGIDTVSNNHVEYCASRLISKDELPEGSIICLAKGWKYRPDAWPKGTSRPIEVTEAIIFVDDAWWGNYTERGFNLSKIGNPSLENNITLQEIEEALIIYVPKN